MVLYCPFCHAPEDERVEAEDQERQKVLLVMFNCPFHYTFLQKETASEEAMQSFLDNWRRSKGDEWLESVGPVMKRRELQNIAKYESKLES